MSEQEEGDEEHGCTHEESGGLRGHEGGPAGGARHRDDLPPPHHRHARGLPESGIIVAAAGVAGIVGTDCITARNAAFDAVEPFFVSVVSVISFVLCGVGAVTTSMPAKNTLKAARL